MQVSQDKVWSLGVSGDGQGRDCVSRVEPVRTLRQDWTSLTGRGSEFCPGAVRGDGTGQLGWQRGSGGGGR